MKQDENTPIVKDKPGSKHPRWKSLLVKIAIPLAVSIGLCWVMFRDIDFHDMLDIVRHQCDFRYIALMLALSILPMFFRAMRWGIQLRYNGITPPLHILCYSIFGTYAVNLVFPRLGEVWRSGYIAYRQRAPFSEVFGSMVADRLSDTLAVGLITLFTLIVARGPITDFISTYPAVYRQIASILSSPWFWGLIVIIFGGTWSLLHFSRNPRILRVRKFVLGLWEGFAAIFRMEGKLRWLLLTTLIWGIYFLQLYVAFYAFPFTREMLADNGITVVLVCYVLTSISMGIPSNGGIGPYQATMLFGMRVFTPAAVLASAASSHAFTTQALAFGNLLIASQTALMALLGLVTFLLISIDRHRHPRVAGDTPGNGQ